MHVEQQLELHAQVGFDGFFQLELLKSSIDKMCEHGTVHLVGGDEVSRGRVEYCHEGSWHSVCNSTWGEEETKAVCKSLGYSTAFGNVLL